jgi:hypothetical protein
MEYVCVDARFLFFDGQSRYTVEFSFGLNKWFVFKDKKNTDALYVKEVKPSKSKTPNRGEAKIILYEYLDSVV